MANEPSTGPLLAGKRGLIIGGTSGLGLASARQIVAWGGTVIPASSNPDKVRAALDTLAQAEDLPALTVTAQDKESVTGCVQDALAALGRLDFLCYFAGLLRPGPIEALDEALLDEAFAVNTKGALWAAQAAFPTMKAQGGGAMVIIASMAAHGGWGGFPSYAISKHAVLGLATNLANEWGQYNIRVIPVSPGVIITDLNRANMEKNVERTSRFIEDTALGRLGETHEVGAVVAFLCSDAASYVTGSPVIVDGGMLNRNARPLRYDT
jgi:NAD(P)-dependent dehydrogenase (short-subunit alcohol dehydrogenase family)